MKKALVFGSILIVFIVTAASARPPQGSPKVVGSWDMTTESPNGTRTSLLVIKQEGDKLSASMKGQRGERPLDSISVKGDEITMVMTVQFQGQDMVITYKGKIEKDSLKGEADFGGLAPGTWSAVPHKEGAPGAAPPAPATGAPPAASSSANDISGVWNASVETQMGTGTPVFTFKQEGEKLTGTYKGQLGEAPLTGTIKGNDVTFSISVNAQGQDITVTYTGKLEGKDAMKGTARFGDLGEGKWTAKKQ